MSFAECRDTGRQVNPGANYWAATASPCSFFAFAGDTGGKIAFQGPDQQIPGGVEDCPLSLTADNYR
jgi:hypothetical protein